MAKTELLIISDTHGRGDLVKKAIRLARPHLILFCGDGLRDLADLPPSLPLYAVRGNCDVFFLTALGDIQESMTLNLDGVRLFVAHGHRLGVKSGLGEIVSQGVREDADAVIFGHTHEPLDMLLLPPHADARLGISLHKPLHLFNPGSLGYAPHSFGTLTIRDGVPLFGHGQLEP